MHFSKLLLLAPLLCLSLRAQDVTAERRKSLAEAPRLPVEEVPLAARLPNTVQLGTVSSVASDRNGIIYVLQRGDKADPVIAVNREGQIVRTWGKGMFTVPHSIRVDPDGNIWTVDAGSSVLLKFSPEGKKLQEISVGEVATADKCAVPTLCGTTDVTFGPEGRLYISDGYGNARILEYLASGRRIRVWGSAGKGPAQFHIPHGIANDGRVIYVADRENARIQRFDLSGKYLGEWKDLGRPFALKIENGALWVAVMVVASGRGKDVKPAPWYVKLDPATGKILGQTPAPGPHSIDVNEKEELFASGCCGGSNPTGFSFLKRMP